MKKIRIGITAIALLSGIIASYTTMALGRVGTYWLSGGGTVYLTTAAASFRCFTFGRLCAVQYTSGGHPTGFIMEMYN